MKRIFTSFILSLLCVVAVNAQDYVVEPPNGSVVESLADIYITWETATTIDVDVALMVGGIKAYKIEGENKTFATDVLCGPAWGNYINLTMMNPTIDAGEYLIEIPDNMITVDGVVVPAFNLNYTISGMATSEATFEIASDGGSLNTLYLTVSPCNELQLNEEEDVEAPFLIKNDGFNSSIAAHYTITITGANTATLTADKSVADGNYTLHIPRANLIVDGNINPLLMKDFNPTAVNGVTKDAERVTIYNLKGVQVVGNGNADEINNLQPGVYIVNGTKKLIRNSK